MGNVQTATRIDIEWLSPDTAAARLNALLAANAEIANARRVYRSDAEEFDAAAMKRPVDSEKAFAYLGLTLGSLGPFSILLKIIAESYSFDPGLVLVISLFLVANAATAAIGYGTGKAVGRMISSMREHSWPTFIALSLLLGVAWGAISGGIGGTFLFVVGGIFGAVTGAMAAAFVLPVFAIAHRLLSRGHLIEMKHFLPLAFGTVLTVSAFFLGLN